MFDQGEQLANTSNPNEPLHVYAVAQSSRSKTEIDDFPPPVYHDEYYEENYHRITHPQNGNTANSEAINGDRNSVQYDIPNHITNTALDDPQCRIINTQPQEPLPELSNGIVLTSFSTKKSLANITKNDDHQQLHSTTFITENSKIIPMKNMNMYTNCLKCLHASPCASLIALIVSIFGLGAFCGGTLFGIVYVRQLILNNPKFLYKPILDYFIYGLTSGTFVYLILLYVICAISTGWNRRRLFEGSSKVKCGRVMNMLMIVVNFIALICWCGICCVLTLPLKSILTTDILRSKSSSDPQGEILFCNESISAQKFECRRDNIFVCACIAFGGAFLILIGLIQFMICIAMNYVRMASSIYPYYEQPEKAANVETCEHNDTNL